MVSGSTRGCAVINSPWFPGAQEPCDFAVIQVGGLGSTCAALLATAVAATVVGSMVGRHVPCVPISIVVCGAILFSLQAGTLPPISAKHHG